MTTEIRDALARAINKASAAWSVAHVPQGTPFEHRSMAVVGFNGGWDACLAHLRERIPGLDALLDGSAVVVPRDVLSELTEALAVELAVRYGARDHYPSVKADYDGAIVPVTLARELLAASPFAGEK